MNITQERAWKTGIVVGALLVAFLAVLTIKEIKSIAYVGHDTAITNTISVNGTGDAVAKPDVATFSFSVNETGTTVAQAQSAATDKINAALKAVRASGVSDNDIKTLSYDIAPHYEYYSGICTVNDCPPSKSTLTGYDVSETIQVKVRDLTKAGDLFGTIVSAGVQNVNSLAFSVDQPESIQSQARSTAIADAQSKARELAKELGVSLGRVISFTESSGDEPSPIMYGMSDKASAPMAAPQIPAGQQKITSNVTVTYEIQ